MNIPIEIDIIWNLKHTYIEKHKYEYTNIKVSIVIPTEKYNEDHVYNSYYLPIHAQVHEDFQ